MAWKIEFERDAQRELEELDKPIARRILKFLRQPSQRWTTLAKLAKDCKVL
jgi:mRNA-degrading endonuclease RelE of RelBE toxin-antitoxin system